MGFFYSQLFITPAYPTRSFEGETIIVTGANSGLGKESCRHFARLGARKVIIAARNTTAGEEAKSDIISSTKCNPKSMEVWQLDLSSYKSVKEFANRATKELDRIDAVVENAGIASSKPDIAEETGYERSITVNVINTFYLALLMLPKLKQTAKQYGVHPRLTIVSSEVHASSEMPELKEANTFDALNKCTEESMNRRYPNSKLLEVLVVRQIAPQLQGSGVILNMLNPGFCFSELGREQGLAFKIFQWLLARTTEVGSRTLVAAAEAGDESHGGYMSDAKVENESLSSFVQSADGKKAAEKVWNELKTILEKVDKGVTNNVSA